MNDTLAGNMKHSHMNSESEFHMEEQSPDEESHEIWAINTRLKIGTVLGLSSLCLFTMCFLKYRQHRDEKKFRVKQEVKVEQARYVGYERAQNFAEMEQWREFNDEGIGKAIGQIHGGPAVKNQTSRYTLEETKG